MSVCYLDDVSLSGAHTQLVDLSFSYICPLLGFIQLMLDLLEPTHIAVSLLLLPYESKIQSSEICVP